MLANPAGVNYESHAEKIPGDKKHVEEIISQDHCLAQFNTAQNRRIVTTRLRPILVVRGDGVRFLQTAVSFSAGASAYAQGHSSP